MLMSKKTVFTGADVVTMSSQLPKAEAVCVSNGRIECVGTQSDVLRYVAAMPHEVVQLGGGTLYPGFIDTHSHICMFSEFLDQCHCGLQHGSIANVLQALREKAAHTPRGEWVRGYGYDDSGIPDNRHMHCRDLDSVSTTHPILVSHISGHMGYANTLGLERLGFSAGADIAGGEVVLGEDGKPTGFLVENALFEAFSKMPLFSDDALCNNVERAVAEYNKHGITTFLDGGMGIVGTATGYVRAYNRLVREGRLTARAYLQFLPEAMDAMLNMGVSGISNDKLTFGGVKYFVDGSIQGFTAALIDDYHTRPGFKSRLLQETTEIEELIAHYHNLGLQIAVHTNGDLASEVVITAFEKAVAQTPRTDLRHMLVHAQMVSDAHLARMKACGIIPTFFSRHIEVWGDRHASLFVGPERAARMNPAGSAARMNMPFGLHVDTPVLPVTVLGSIHAAVNRITSNGQLLGADQRITPRQALEAYTTNAALCCYGEHDRGCIEAGRYADFVLLDNNLETIDPQNIRNVQVRKTICGGRIVYSAE